MIDNKFLKEPIEIIEFKMHLAKLAIDYGRAVAEKWEKHAALVKAMNKEELLAKQITDETKELEKLMCNLENGKSKNGINKV